MSWEKSTYDILKSPVITEKATTQRMNDNKYIFYVDSRSTKAHIRDAVEKTFSVTVISVNTQNVKGKPRRLGRYMGKTSERKKAVVTLKEGDRIKLMEGP